MSSRSWSCHLLGGLAGGGWRVGAGGWGAGGWGAASGTRLGADDDLVGRRVVGDGVEGLAVVVEAEAVSDHAVRPDPAVAHGVDRGAERRDLRERPPDGDLTPEHVERVERDGV